MISNLFKNRILNKIETIGRDVQALINIEFNNENIKLNNDSPLNQAGMKDGIDIINEFNSVGEYGLAFDHILYMIDETDILINESTSTLITQVSKTMEISIRHIKDQLKN